jgi:hypothetical protein
MRELSDFNCIWAYTAFDVAYCVNSSSKINTLPPYLRLVSSGWSINLRELKTATIL